MRDMIKTFNFDPKKTWLVHIELDTEEVGLPPYIIYIDGEEKESIHWKIEFAVKEETQLKDIWAKVEGTKGIKELTVRLWER
jgi:hypothetical protein